MIITDQTIVRDLKAGILKEEELANFLLRTYPSTVLAKELASEILDKYHGDCKPVVLSMEQFQQFFRVQGYRVVDGELIKETRGHFRKKD